MKGTLKLIAITTSLSLLLVIAGFTLSTYLFQSAVTDSVGAIPSLPVSSYTKEVATTTDTYTGRGSVATILGLNKDLECTFQFNEDSPYKEGTGFFSGGMVRVDVLYRVGATTSPFVSSFIYDKNNFYGWGTTADGAYAITATTTANFAVQSPQKLDLETNATYICNAWHVDASVFVPPSSIKFK
jgi:hypothetical protein